MIQTARQATNSRRLKTLDPTRFEQGRIVPLPGFDSAGDLPLGVHQASLDEVVARFGQSTLQRQVVTVRLLRVYEIASGTGKLDRFIIFGSYVTAKPNPNDVDIILVMRTIFVNKNARSKPSRCLITCARKRNLARVFLLFDLVTYCWRRSIALSRTGRSKETKASTE